MAFNDGDIDDLGFKYSRTDALRDFRSGQWIDCIGCQALKRDVCSTGRTDERTVRVPCTSWALAADVPELIQLAQSNSFDFGLCLGAELLLLQKTADRSPCCLTTLEAFSSIIAHPLRDTTSLSCDEMMATY